MFRAQLLELTLVAALVLGYCEANLGMFSRQGTGKFRTVSTSLVAYNELACCRECNAAVGCRGVNFNTANLTCELVINVDVSTVITHAQGWEYYVFDNPNTASQSTTSPGPASSTSVSVPSTSTTPQLTTTTPITTTPVLECIPGWEPMLSSCYQFVMAGLSWDDARVNCDVLQSGANLLDVNSYSEQLYLEVYMIQNGLAGTVWTDGKHNGADYIWFSINELLANGWTNWETPTYPDGQPCVALIRNGSDYKWITLDCAENNPYVCEYPKIQPATVAPQLATTASNGCLPGWRAMFAKCYQFVLAPLPWDGAQANCEILRTGSTLIDISSATEQLFFEGYMVQSGLSGHVWLGGRDNGTDYVWRRTDEPIANGWSNWKTSQPVGQPCAVLDMGDPDYKWDTLDCSFPKPYVCQYAKIL